MRRPSMRTVTAVAVAGAFGLAALSAGSASATTSRATSLPPCPLSALAKAQHPVQITAWHTLTQANATALQAATTAFNQSQSQVHVTLVPQPTYNDTQEKFVAGLSTGDLPDVAQIQDTGLQQMIDTRSILPVQSCIDADHYTSQLSDFIPRTLSYWTVKGVLEGMPFNVSNPVFFYNKAAFQKAGLDPNSPPTTLAEVMADAQKLKASGAVSQAGYGLKTDPSDLEEWVAKAGEQYVNNGNGRSARATQATFNDSAAQQVFAWMSQMVKSGLAVVNNDENTEAYNNLIGIGNGNQAMTIDTSATLGTITQLLNSGQYPGVDLGVGPMPGPTGPTPGGVLVGGAAFYIVNKSSPAKQAAAWEYVKYLDSPQTQATFAAATGYVPIRKSSVTLPAIQQLWAKIPGYKVAYEQLVNGPSNVATAGPVIGDYQSVRDAVRNAEEAMFSSGASSSLGAGASGEELHRGDPGLQLAGRVAQRDRIVTDALAPRPTVWARPTRRVVDLAGPGRAAQLAGQLDHLPQRRRAERLALRQQAAARVDGQPAAEPGVTVVDEAALLAGLAEAELLVGEQLSGRVGVLALDDVEVAGADPGRRVRVPGGQGGGGRDVGVVDAAHRCRLAEHRAGQVGAQHRGVEAHRARRGVGGSAQHHGRRALVRGAEHEQVQRLAHHPGGEDLVDRRLGPEHGVRVVHPVAAVLHHHLGQLLLRDARLPLEPLGPQREVGGGGGQAGLLAPRLEERGADDALRHLLDPEHEHRVVLPGPDRARGEHERRCAARAAGLDVHDRDAGAAERAEHLVARGDPGVGGAAERGVEAGVAGLVERGAHGGDAEVGDGPVGEPTEGMDPQPGDPHVAAHGAGANE